MHRNLLIAAIAAVALGLVWAVLYVRWRKSQVVESEHTAAPLRVVTLVRVEPAEDAASASLADQMIGEWEVTASYINGESVFMPNPARVHVYLMYRGEPPALAEQPFGRQEWMIDGSRSPAHADVRVIRESTTAPTAPRPGILSVEGDRIEHSRAFGDEAPRPATFGEGRAKGYAAMSLSRLK